MKDAKNKVMAAVAIVLCVVLIPVLVVNLTLIIKSFVYPDEVPAFLGYKPFIVLSGSMEPEFSAGDLVIVKEVRTETLAAGDIIAFWLNNSVVTHRITEINDSGPGRQFFTKGDNNNAPDNIAVTADMIEGKYLLRISGVGNFAMFMQTPLGMVMFIAVPFMLFVLYDMHRRRHYYLREKKLQRQMEEELAQLRQQLAERRAQSADAEDK